MALLLCWGWLGTEGEAADYYVAAGLGSDSTGEGSAATPWASIGYAVSQVTGTSSAPATINLMAGSYPENIRLAPYTRLRGGYGPAWQRDWTMYPTIVDGPHTEQSTVATAAETRLDGMTIISRGQGAACGVECIDATAVIRHCRISGGAGGVRGENGAMWLEDCRISASVGVYAWLSSLAVVGCDVANNTTGVEMQSGSGLFLNSVFRCNRTEAINLKSTAPEITNCVFYHNGTWSGAIHGEGARGTKIRNCIFDDDGTEFFGVSATYSCFRAPTSGEGNLCGLPFWEDPEEGDFHLRPGSMCIDRGTTAVRGGATDVDDDSRPGPDGLVDMGVDETPPEWTPPTPGRRYVDGDAQGQQTGENWADAFTSLQSALAQAIPGDEFWVAEGVYAGTLELIPEISLYGGFAGNETAREQRSWAAHGTTIRGGGTAFLVFAAEGTLMDGFVVESTSAVDDYCDYGCYRAEVANCTIANCTITSSQRPGLGRSGIVAQSAGVVVRNCVIRNTGSDEVPGGGIYGRDSTLVVEDSAVVGNYGRKAGGILMESSGQLTMRRTMLGDSAETSCCLGFTDAVSAEIENCTITSNGGTGVYCWNSNWSVEEQTVLRRCTIRENRTGVDIEGSSVALVDHCRIEDNTGEWGSGAIFCQGRLRLLNSIVARNYSGGSAAVCVRYGGQLEAANCVFFDSRGDPFSAVEADADSRARIYNSILWNGDSDATGCEVSYCCTKSFLPGIGNIQSRPGWVDTTDFHLSAASACIDRGTAAVPWLPPTDFDGDPRPGADGLVDIGVDEAPPEWTSGPVDNTTRVWYVDQRAIAGTQTGTEWANALLNIGDATLWAASGDCIWVAGGRYPGQVRAKEGTPLWGGFAGGENTISERRIAEQPTIIDGIGEEGPALELVGSAVADGLTITGGQSGVSCRSGNPQLWHCTIAGNSNSSGGGMYAESCSPLVVDCTISDNYASLMGGGVYSMNCEAHFRDCRIQFNRASGPFAWGGAGFFADAGEAVIENCLVSDNVVSGDYNGRSAGAGAYLRMMYANFTGCTVARNRVEAAWSGEQDSARGGGLYVDGGGRTTLCDCRLEGNQAPLGGGVQSEGTLQFEHCTLENNLATVGGGAHLGNCIFQADRCQFNCNRAALEGGGLRLLGMQFPATLTNCLISRCSAGMQGGGVAVANSSPQLINCMIASCAARSGGGLLARDGSQPVITNSILWWNAPGSLEVVSAESPFAVPVTYSDVEGGWPGAGNISAPPQFVDPACPEPCLVAPGQVLPSTPLCLFADYHLQPGSPCVDRASLVDGVTTDLDGNVRSAPYDMGAYEFSAAFATPTPQVSPTPLSSVRPSDVLRLVRKWHAYSPFADFNGDGRCDAEDLFWVYCQWRKEAEQ